MKHRGIRRCLALCAAAFITFSAAGACFAGEWADTDKGKMYLDGGTAVTGIRKIDGETYCFDSKGIMRTGWVKTKSGRKYYFGSDGVMKTGWLKAKSGRYYLGESGAAVTGTVKISGNYYSFDDNGVMLTGWQEFEGEEYYYLKNGKRAAGMTLNIDGEKVKFDRNGRVIKRTSAENWEENTDNEVYPTRITVISDEIPLKTYSSSYITYSFKPLNTTYRDVYYKSSDSSVVSIDKYGKMTAKKEGTCYITVASAYDRTIRVTVKATVT